MTISFQLRLKLYMRDCFTCRYCGLPMNPLAEDLTLDHVDPLGPDTEENLVTACRRCNSKKGQKSKEEYESQLHQERFARIADVAEPVDHIIAKASVMFQMKQSAILKRSRVPASVNARAWVAQEARKAGHSLPEIGRALGLHHTSVMYLIDRPIKGLSTEEAAENV